LQNSAKAVDTREELAKAAKVSHDTIAKVEKIKESAPLPVVQAARQNEISINSAYQVTKLEPEEQQEIAERIQNIKSEPKETNTPKAIVQEVLKRPHVSFNSGNNEWYTPAEFIEAAVKVMGKIDLDPASNEIANKVVQATTFYTSETNGLAHEWSGNIWLNPPYSSDLIGKFADKVISEYGNYSQMIILVNNATETEWFCKLVSKASAVVFPKSRVKFYMPDGRTGAPLQGQAVLYIGSSPEKFLDCFKKFGWGAFLNGI
jgi:phage N-6-adenine-methyltransferase